MSGKEKPGVTRRLNRGRSAPDSKSKTDSGCFVDEELERNGSTSSDSSQGSINSSPVTELDSKRNNVVYKERKDNIVASVVPSPELTVDNVAERTSVCMQNVMSEDTAINDQHGSANIHEEDRVCNVVEKTRRASDFYCLYYSASPESTLTRGGVNKVKSKPPVPPKPKLRRGSAPPSSFEKIERIQLKNEDITKRFSYNECQNASVKPNEGENFLECDKRKSVEEHVLFFEACAKDGLTENNDLLKNIQGKSLKDSSKEPGVDNREVNKEIQNGFHCFDDQNSMEKVAPIADSEQFSFKKNNGCESVIFNCDVQEQIAPLVEEDEFTVDGSNLSQFSITCDTSNSNYQNSKIGRDCLDCVSEIDEVDGADQVVVNANQEGVNISFDQTEKRYSDQLGSSETDVYTSGIVGEFHNGLQFVDASETRDNHFLVHSKIPYEGIHQVSDCSNRTAPSLESTSDIEFKELLVNPRLNEIKQASLPGFKQQDKNIRQRLPGPIACIPNLGKDASSEMKRRSWSFSTSEPLEIDSLLVHKVHQAHMPRLRTSTWQSENGLSTPCGSSFYRNSPVQSVMKPINMSQEKIGWSSHSRTGQSYYEQSGYTSDDSSVHSEPLFQPQRCRPQSLTRGHIFKSMSCDSSISEMDNGKSFFSENQQKRFRHSLGSRDPVFALRRQSFEFAEDPPPFHQIQAPRLQTLRRTSSNASSSSDSEVERIFSNETSAPRYPHSNKTSMHNGLLSSNTHCKVSAMEALFGPQSTSAKNVTLSTDSEQMRPKAISDKFSTISQLPLAEDFLPEELEEKIAEFTEPKEIEEPRLEFDDTDYSEFYTLCEDKDSMISAEALSIKKLLDSPQTVLPDPDIESVVMSVTEKKMFSPSSDDKRNSKSQEVLYDSDIDDADQAISVVNSRQFYRWHRGTQTPPTDVFRTFSPSPSVGTQTPPLSVSQELLPPPLLKELQRDLQAPVPSKLSRTLSPTTSQELQSSLLGNIQAVSHMATPFADADRISFQDNDKAVSVEELLQILATMKVGSTEEKPTRRSVSIQRYNCSPTSNVKSRTNTNSLPSSWHRLNSPVHRHHGSEDFKRPRAILPRSSKSCDCLRQGVHSKDKKSGAAQAEAVRGSQSNENIRKKLKEWTFTCKSQLFEEEVECLEEKRKLMKANRKKALKVSYDGSEATDHIETLSKLTKTHSLKRPRRDRAFSQREKNGLEVNSLDEKWRFSLPTPKAKPYNEESKDYVKLEEPAISTTTEESKFEVTSDSLDAEELSYIDNEVQLHEVASPEGVDVFIDYRKKNGLHITSTPKPPPYPGNSLVCREDGVGKNNLNNTEITCKEKSVSVKGAEDVPTDVESQGDASSSSYSSDDDRFGEFGGSTDTVVFVDTENSMGLSLVPDLDTMELKLVGSDNLLSIDNNDGDDDEQDEASLDALLGEVRRSLDLEVVDSDILDKAIERFKQRVSPSSQNKALSGGLSMEAYVALHQADELQGIISEIKGELKLLHEENDMLREQVVTLANQQTSEEVSENSSTESSERLENLYKLYRPKHVNSDDEGDAVEVDVCLRGFSTDTLGPLPFKKKDIHLGTVSLKGADWNGVMEAARRIFVDHINKIDPDGYLCLGAHSIQGVQTGVMLWSPDSLRKSSPRVELSKKSNPCVIQLKDGSHFSCDSLVYDTLLPKETIEKYVEDLLEHRHIVLCGQQSLGKTYLAAKLAEHIVQRVGWKGSPAVVTFNVFQSTRKELKQNLASFMQSDISSPQEGSPAVIVLDQLNCLATLADIFDLSILERNRSCPYIIGVRDKSRRGPFSSKELNLCHYFRWLRVSVNDRQYSGLLGRFLRRKLSWAQIQTNVEGSARDLLDLFDWLSKVWYHLNEILEEYCEPDSTVGPSLFFSCPMDYKAAEGWFVNVWNYNVIPYLHQALRSGRKIFERSITWEDPTKWVILRYPWNKDHSRVLHTLRKLRQVDVVLNRNHLSSDNVCFAECIEENEKILRAHSTVSKRVRTVVQQKVLKGELTTRRTTAEQKRLLGKEEDKDSCYSETDSYLETSI